MPIDYRKIYEKGKFKDLLYQAKSDDTDEGRFWQLIACVNLGLEQEALSVLDHYRILSKNDSSADLEHLLDFSSITDGDLRNNFFQVAKQLNKPLDEINPTATDTLLRSLFSKELPDVVNSLSVKSRPQEWRGNINYGNYFCKFTYKPADVEALKREYNLLRAIQGKLSFTTPNPLAFVTGSKADADSSSASDNSSTSNTSTNPNSSNPPKIHAFIYKIIPFTPSPVHSSVAPQLLDMVLELHQLHTYPEIKELLISYTPELVAFSNELTHDALATVLHHYNIQESQYQMDERNIPSILRFVELCANHIPTEPEQRTFVHGDLHSGNILQNISGEGENKTCSIEGVIDFERCWYADPWLDFAKLSYYGDKHMRDLLDLYSARVAPIDNDAIMLRIMLYRGLYLLRRWLFVIRGTDSFRHDLPSKTATFIIQPLAEIERLAK